MESMKSQADTGFTVGEGALALRDQVAIRDAALAELKRSFEGELLTEDSPGYDRARTVWNAMVDKRPALIARCASTADVVAAVNVARTRGLDPSVRGGGHSVSGKALSDGGLMIDMSLMRAVEVDTERQLVQVQGGCLLGDIDVATASHGLIVPAGIMSETGVAGLALGGGIGWFSRKHGLSCDNFHSVEVVLASGEVIEVSAAEHPDLFWALKGGGGNFGVVTRFVFKAHDFGPMIRIGVTLYRPDDARDALREYARVFPTLPRTVGWHAALKHDMPAQPFVPPELVGERLLMLFSMWLDDAEDPAGVDMVERLNAVGNPCLAVSTVMPFGLGMQRVLDKEFGDGHRDYTREAHLNELTDDAIDILVDYWKDMPMHGEIEVIGLGGAIGDVAEEDSAFSNRHHQLWLNVAMHWDEAENDEEYIARTRAVVDRLKPWIGEGIYVNMLNFDEMDRIVDAYGGPDKYARLGRIKARYDPENLFRVNYNIKPLFD